MNCEDFSLYGVCSMGQDCTSSHERNLVQGLSTRDLIINGFELCFSMMQSLNENIVSLHKATKSNTKAIEELKHTTSHSANQQASSRDSRTGSKDVINELRNLKKTIDTIPGLLRTGGIPVSSISTIIQNPSYKGFNKERSMNLHRRCTKMVEGNSPTRKSSRSDPTQKSQGNNQSSKKHSDHSKGHKKETTENTTDGSTHIQTHTGPTLDMNRPDLAPPHIPRRPIEDTSEKSTMQDICSTEDKFDSPTKPPPENQIRSIKDKKKDSKSSFTGLIRGAVQKLSNLKPDSKLDISQSMDIEDTHKDSSDDEWDPYVDEIHQTYSTHQSLTGGLNEFTSGESVKMDTDDQPSSSSDHIYEEPSGVERVTDNQDKAQIDKTEQINKLVANPLVARLFQGTLTIDHQDIP